MDTKRQISERKRRANRANAQHSTGPRTVAGKAASRRNALKHGILSHLIDLPNPSAERNRSLLQLTVSPVHEVGTDPALQEIHRIWCKLARVVDLDKECVNRPLDMHLNAGLVQRYESMLSNQLHARIREYSGLGKKNSKGAL